MPTESRGVLGAFTDDKTPGDSVPLTPDLAGHSFQPRTDLALCLDLSSDRRQLSGLRERRREPGAERGSDL